MKLHLFPVHWWEDLLEEEAIKRDHQNLIIRCMFHKGYISGGFARLVASKLLGKYIWGSDSPPEALREVERYYRLYRLSSPPREKEKVENISRKSWKSGKGDIDIFFHDKESSYKAINSVESGPFRIDMSSTSPAGFAKEIIVNQCCFQLITKINGTPEEVLQSFDLANAKVALTNDGILVSKNWIELERLRHLGVDRWDKPNILWRVHKWVRRHAYHDLREGDHDRYLDHLFDVVKSAQLGELKMYNKPIDPNYVKKFARDFIHSYPPKEALKASMIMNDYDKIQIMKRISKNDQ